MNQITSLQGLGYDEDPSKNLRNRKVRIASLLNVKDFTPLNTIHTVIIERCDNFTDLRQLKDVKDLSLLYNSRIKSINTELNAKKLIYLGTLKEFSFHHLTKLKELDLRFTTLPVKKLIGLEKAITIQKLLLPKEWEVMKSKGVEILKQDYMKYDYDCYSFLYLRKNQ